MNPSCLVYMLLFLAMAHPVFGMEGNEPKSQQAQQEIHVSGGKTSTVKLQGHATLGPTNYPTNNPTLNPTTTHPTCAPTLSPTYSPTTNIPTQAPSITPTTACPSINPTAAPSVTGPKLRYLSFVDEKRCNVPHCDLSREFKIKFSRKLDVECHFYTPNIHNSPLIVMGRKRREHFTELAERIAGEQVTVCVVLLENAVDEWDYVKDMYEVASQMYEESQYPTSIFTNMIGPRVGFMGTGDAASTALMTALAPEVAAEYLHPALNYTGVIALSPNMDFRGVAHTLVPLYRDQMDIRPPGPSPGVVPLLVLTGGSDCNVPPESNGLPIYGAVEGCKTYIELKGGNRCFYPANATFIEQDREGYKGWILESYQEERESCIINEQQCIDGRMARREPKCKDGHCEMTMTPAMQKFLSREIIGNWARFAFLGDLNSLQKMSQFVLAHQDEGVQYYQRGCEYPGYNLP